MGKGEKKTRWFLVPKEAIGNFFTELEESGLDYEFGEVEDGKLEVEVGYSNTERDEVMTLIEIIDEHSGEEEETEES